jgi:hypothetical protein
MGQVEPPAEPELEDPPVQPGARPVTGLAELRATQSYVGESRDDVLVPPRHAVTLVA